ncbi:unnamed protein product [Parnassius apollo]|uniref:Odorant receptor n=1 Tax=Parnassius apollo TaxID=110799 RepID=A0A8S3W6U4_PARAO|nr:unnamed protein product [Parnassius apollo]
MWKLAEKFGLKYSDLPTMLWSVSTFLKVLCVNIDKRDKKRIPIFFYVLTVVGASSYSYVYIISMVWFVLVRYPQTDDLLAAVIVFSLGISSVIGITKLIYALIYINSIRDLVEGYLVCDFQVTQGSRFHTNLTKYLREVKKRALTFWIVIMSNGVAYATKPMILPGKHLAEDLYVIYGLEPMHESPNYEIAMALTTVGVLFACYTTANITAFFITISGYNEAQTLALSEELLLLWNDAKTFYQETQNQIYNPQDIVFNVKAKLINQFIKDRLKDIVKRHAVNINLLRRLDNVYRGAVATEFLILIVALIAELLGGLANTYLELPFALCQVAMDCVIGQRLLDANDAFESAVYACNWENFDKSNMKTVLVILQNSQKPFTLSAGGVAILNFVCLMSVLRSVYSAYMTLSTVLH